MNARQQMFPDLPLFPTALYQKILSLIIDANHLISLTNLRLVNRVWKENTEKWQEHVTAIRRSLDFPIISTKTTLPLPSLPTPMIVLFAASGKDKNAQIILAIDRILKDMSPSNQIELLISALPTLQKQINNLKKLQALRERSLAEDRGQMITEMEEKPLVMPNETYRRVLMVKKQALELLHESIPDSLVTDPKVTPLPYKTVWSRDHQGNLRPEMVPDLEQYRENQRHSKQMAPQFFIARRLLQLQFNKLIPRDLTFAERETIEIKSISLEKFSANEVAKRELAIKEMLLVEIERNKKRAKCSKYSACLTGILMLGDIIFSAVAYFKDYSPTIIGAGFVGGTVILVFALCLLIKHAIDKEKIKSSLQKYSLFVLDEQKAAERAIQIAALESKEESMRENETLGLAESSHRNLEKPAEVVIRSSSELSHYASRR